LVSGLTGACHGAASTEGSGASSSATGTSSGSGSATSSGSSASSGAGGSPMPSQLTCAPVDCGASTGKLVNVPEGTNLQAALDAAAPGDTLVLDAGATYSGHYHLANKSGAGCITVRTATSDADLPPDTRVTPAEAPMLARIITPGGGLPAIATNKGAHNWRFIGIEIAPSDASAQFYDLAEIGNGETVASDLPSNIVFDRCYVHGFPNVNQKRGIALNGAATCVIHSTLADFHSDMQDSQAMGGHNGSGPFRIMDNEIEGSTENILFGGAVPTLPNVVPSDIVIRGNHFFKPLAWMKGNPANTGYLPWVKNLFELKNAENVVLDGNVMENNWVGADQHGAAILLTPRSENGAVPWAVVQNVKITNNVILHVGGCAELAGFDTTGPTLQTNHVTIANNVCADIRQDYALDIVRVFQFSEIATLDIDHNTFQYGAGSWPIFRTYGMNTTGFSYTNNVVEFREGAWSDCGSNSTAFSCRLPGSTSGGNVLIGGTQGALPGTNYYPAMVGDVGFIDYANGLTDFHGYALGSGSAYKGKGTDGKDPGVDAAAIDAARIGN